MPDIPLPFNGGGLLLVILIVVGFTLARLGRADA